MEGKLVGAYVDPATHEAIRVAAFAARCSMAEWIRRAITTALKQPKGKKR